MTTILKTIENLIKKVLGNKPECKTTEFQESFLKHYDNDEENHIIHLKTSAHEKSNNSIYRGNYRRHDTITKNNFRYGITL